MADQLRRIEDVTVPHAFEGGGGNQILPPVLFGEESDISLELFECFT